MNIDEAIEILNKNYHKYSWDHNELGKTKEEQMITPWFAGEEEIMISAHKDVGIQQKFHRHDFFFINYAWHGDFEALSQYSDKKIVFREGDCYMGQPYSGFAVVAEREQANTIVAILIKRETFFKDFFSGILTNPKLFHFFLDAQQNSKSDEALYISFDHDPMIRHLVEIMCIEYAQKDEHTQNILKPLVLSFFLLLIRQYERQTIADKEQFTLAQQIEQYIGSHYQNVTLQSLSDHFSYHPNYISSYIKKNLNVNFSQIVLKKRMENALLLLKNSTLSIEEIAFMIGYMDPSNFYKAFKAYYNTSPREWIKANKS